jgi:hypothetical protein
MLQIDGNRGGMEDPTDLQGSHLPDRGITEDIDHFLGQVDVVSAHVGSPIGDEVGQPSRPKPGDEAASISARKQFFDTISHIINRRDDLS